MARKFLTHIDLNQLELQNAAVQNLASAPENPVLGQIYFDTTLGYLRTCSGVAVGATPATWISGGESLISSVSGNLSVDGAGDLTINQTGLESTLETNGFVKATDGSISIPGGSGDLTVTADANIVLNAATGSTTYLDSATAGNEVATTTSVADAIAASALNSTDDLQEGVNNLYFTGARVGQYISDNNLSLQGAQGAQGADGYIGSDGAQGIQGEQGLQGEAGYMGADGAQGATGAQGETGAQGIEGAQGIQGANAGILSVNGPLTVGVQGDLGLAYGAGLGLAGGTDLVVNTDGSLRTDAGVGANQLGVVAGPGLTVGVQGLTVDVDTVANTLNFTGINADILTVNTDVIATRSYVDNAVSGLTWKPSVNLLANTDVNMTGLSGSLVIDGHAALDAADDGLYRILLTGQAISTENGIYTYTDTGSVYTLVRADDADAYTELVGAAVFIEEGTTYAGTGWVQSNHYLTSFADQSWTKFSASTNYITSVSPELTVINGTLSVSAGYYDAAGAAAQALTDANDYTDTAVAGKADAADATLTGTLTLDGTGDFVVNADANVVFETPAGNVYLGASTSGNEVATEGYVDTAVTGMVKKKTHLIEGNNSSTSFYVDYTSVLGMTQSVNVEVWEASTGQKVETDVSTALNLFPSESAVATISFAVAPAANENYTVVITG